MKTIKLGPNHLKHGSLILVTPQISLCSNVQPEELLPASPHRSDVQLEHTAATLLAHLLRRIQSGNRILPTSGYRTYEEQKEIWDHTLETDGFEFTKKYVALPGHSEHQTGLAIDLAENQKKIDPICPSFPYSGICQKFRQMAPHFGFIERYLPGKEDITGIGAEPWHFRYVGFPHSMLIAQKHMVLEEYISFLREETSPKHPLVFPHGSQQIEIFHLLPEENGYVSITIPENIPYLISGTNANGFIISLWRNSYGK